MNVVIEGNNIFSIDIYGKRECIGVTSTAYKEMQKAAELATEKAEEFYNLKEEKDIAENLKTINDDGIIHQLIDKLD